MNKHERSRSCGRLATAETGLRSQLNRYRVLPLSFLFTHFHFTLNQDYYGVRWKNEKKKTMLDYRQREKTSLTPPGGVIKTTFVCDFAPLGGHVKRGTHLHQNSIKLRTNSEYRHDTLTTDALLMTAAG